MGKSLDGKELGNGILQKKNGRYEARFVDRFGKRVSISGNDLKDVKRRFNEAMYENDKEINVRESITLDNWFNKWMNIYKYDVIRPTSKIQYNNIYRKHISPTLGNYYLKDITQINVKELLKNLEVNGYKYDTRNKVKIILLDVFNKAISNEYVTKNPARGISIKKEENNVRVLSTEEQTLFFDCCKGTFYDNFFIVAVTTGMRIGELAGLNINDIDFENKTISVKRTLVYQKYENDTQKEFHFENPKTKASIRKIPISRQCEIALKKQILQKNIIKSKAPIVKGYDDEFKDLLFTTKFNTPLNPQTVVDAIKRIVNEINLTRDVTEEIDYFSCHCFRHTFATRCFEAGISPKTIQSYLGHATLQMTMDLYTSVFEEFKSMEISKFESSIDTIFENGDNLANQRYDKMNENNPQNIIRFGDSMVV